jgi:stringent starvation protein B
VFAFQYSFFHDPMSATPPSIGSPGSSTRPYLIRALHDWCTDNGFTPYVAVFVDETVRVPMEYVKNNEIVLNVGFEATTGLKLGNDHLEFKARFGGTSRDIFVPIDHVIAIYARENGQGMAFPVPSDAAAGVKPTVLSAVSTQAPAAASSADKKAAGLRLAPEAAERADQGASRGLIPMPTDLSPDTPPTGSGGSRPSLKRIK